MGTIDMMIESVRFKLKLKIKITKYHDMYQKYIAISHNCCGNETDAKQL